MPDVSPAADTFRRDILAVGAEQDRWARKRLAAAAAFNRAANAVEEAAVALLEAGCPDDVEQSAFAFIAGASSLATEVLDWETLLRSRLGLDH